MTRRHFFRIFYPAFYPTFRVISYVFAVIVVLCAASWPEQAAYAQDDPTKHTVQQGETLFRIALRYNVAVDQLAALNGIYDPALIQAGQVLTVPVAVSLPAEAVPAPAIPPSAPVVVPPAEVQPTADNPVPVAAPVAVSGSYVVEQGDTLNKIATKFGVDAFALLSANNIANPNLIYPGENIVIPEKLPPGAPPRVPAAPTVPEGSGNRVIVVILSQQMVYAYENGALVRSTLSSTGLPGTPTVQGTYAVYAKYPAQLMYGPGYYLPNVQWVMYFYQGYGLHGTYWHTNFGHPMSHGCVNLPNDQAEWLYNFASVGTPVIVRWA